MKTASTDLTGITPENFAGVKEYTNIFRENPKPEHLPKRVKALRMNYPFHIRQADRPQTGKKGDYIVFLQSVPMVVSRKRFENIYRQNAQ